MTNEVDINENDILSLDSELLTILLKDHTTSMPEKQHNIFWATSDYKSLGTEYEYHSPITPELITGDNSHIITPRITKDAKTQTSRVRDKAEVFTPSWVCNSQNNLVDNAWFGRENVFNTETTTKNGSHTWTTNKEKIKFPDGKTWQSYVRENRMEITCGEAPYLVSRYDTTTGHPIPIKRRIGLLDRKLRIVCENVDESGKWLKAVQEAYKSTYAYEWQGDSLLLAREALLYTFIDYFKYKFGKQPQLKSLEYIAYIISWNVWQMDGLKGVVPDSCKNDVEIAEATLFGDIKRKIFCNGCKNDDIHHHNGTYCLIKDWRAKDPDTGKKGKKIKFVDLIKK